MDLFSIFLKSAVGWGAGKALDTLAHCFRCGQKDEKRIGNVQYNHIECSNCHKMVNQFTNSCKFTLNKHTSEIGHAIWGPADHKHQWISEGGFLKEKKSFLKIPFSLLVKGLNGRSIVIETVLSQYESELFIVKASSLENVNSNRESWNYAHGFQDGNFKGVPKCIVAADIKILSEYKDVLYEDRRLIKPWK
jgi:hypothetical protein